jgi:hypothetical protein
LRSIYGDERVAFTAGPETGGFEARLDLPMVPHGV